MTDWVLLLVPRIGRKEMTVVLILVQYDSLDIAAAHPRLFGISVIHRAADRSSINEFPIGTLIVG